MGKYRNNYRNITYIYISIKLSRLTMEQLTKWTIMITSKAKPNKGAQDENNNDLQTTIFQNQKNEKIKTTEVSKTTLCTRNNIWRTLEESLEMRTYQKNKSKRKKTHQLEIQNFTKLVKNERRKKHNTWSNDCTNQTIQHVTQKSHHMVFVIVLRKPTKRLGDYPSQKYKGLKETYLLA